jgi:hypothetical protein
MAGVAWSRRHRAMQVWVWGDAGVHSCVLERYARSGRSGRLAGVGWHGRGCVAR